MRDDSLPRTVSLISEQQKRGLHIGAQLYVSKDFREIANVAMGDARPGHPMTTDHLAAWMSAGKPITAVAIAQLCEKKLLSLDDSVEKYIPEFGKNGKESITIRHCLTHTSGFRGPLNNFTAGTWEQIIERICAMKREANWTPGERAGYHVATSWFILAEIIQRVARRAYCDYLRSEIFLPLDMPDAWIGMPPMTYREYGDRLALLPTMKSGVADLNNPINSESGNTLPRPGANFRVPAVQFAKFYEFLLSPKPPILSSATAAAITSPQRVGMFDHTFNAQIDFGLGFIVNSAPYDPNAPYLYGPHASPRTFGHSGNQSSVAFTDPEHNLVVALAFNGMPGEAEHQVRMREVLTLLYEEIGIA